MNLLGLLIGNIILCAMSGTAWAETQPAGHQAKVIWIMDGDSLVLRVQEEANADVARVIAEAPRGWDTDPAETDEYVANLMGVDAAGWQGEGGDCYAEEAAKYLHDLVHGQQVTVRWDSGDKVDGRRRLLIYVEHDGKDINAEVLRHGYGWVPRRFPADKKEAYLEIERTAREAKKGLWGACSEAYRHHPMRTGNPQR